MKKTVFFGLLIIVLAFCFIGCDEGNGNGNETGNGNDDNGKSIIINNFPGNEFNGKYGQLCIWSTPEGVEGYELDGLVAFSEIEFKNTNQTITFPLIRNVQNYPVWTGSGNYYISLAIFSVTPEKSFDLNEIGDTIEKYFLYDGTSNQKYNIQNVTSTISWNDFWDTDDE